MSTLGTKEQIIYDHITSNRGTKEFWDNFISQMRNDSKSEDEIALELEEKLISIYMQCEEASSEIEALIDRVSMMTVDFMSIAFKLLGRDFRQEAIDYVTKSHIKEEPLSSRVERYVRINPAIPTDLSEFTFPYSIPIKKKQPIFFKIAKMGVILLLSLFICALIYIICFALFAHK